MTIKSDCIFCQIAAKQADASIVYENGKVIAFMDLHPINEGHVLVVPKFHSERLRALPPNIAAAMLEAAQKILIAIESSSINCEGSNLFLSDGAIAGQEVPHSHLHITPRFRGDGHRMGFSGADANKTPRKSLDSTAEKIKKHLALNYPISRDRGPRQTFCEEFFF